MATDPYRYFRIEARELLDQLAQGVLDLEKGALPGDVIPRLLRVAHTLKGAGRVVKQTAIAGLAHEIEDVLAAARDAGGAVPPAGIAALLHSLDAIGEHVAALNAPLDSPAVTAPHQHAAPAETTPQEELYRAFRPDLHEMKGLEAALAETHSHVSGLVPVLAQLERSRHLVNLLIDHFDAPKAADTIHGNRQVRALVEDLQTLVTTIEREASRRTEQAQRHIREARGSAERLQLVPASALFTLLERTARDVAAATGHRVHFAAAGGEIGVDAQVLSTVQGALVQAVRNAVAHGIEPPGSRGGKPIDGRIRVSVERRGARVVFRCSDDGRGVDLDRVATLARQKGLLPADGPADPKTVAALLLNGGLSTATTVTGVAGRGVGLDVVREAARRLNGEARIVTERGAGTTVEIDAPLTMAALRALQVEASGATALLPLDAVRGSMRSVPADIIHTAGGQAVLYDNRPVPLARLGLAVAAGVAPALPARPCSVVVVAAGDECAAFVIDRVLGAREIVVRPLPALAAAAPVVAGVMLDEEGVPRPVLDPAALVAGATRALAAVTATAPVRAPVLVVDDSLTTRMLEQSILESAGYQVELAGSAEEALEKARVTRYALFLVDVEMPGMDGFTFVERLRDDPELRGIPAILVTSRNAPEDIRRGKDAGARAYIVKGEFDQGVLLDRIRGLIG